MGKPVLLGAGRSHNLHPPACLPARHLTLLEDEAQGSWLPLLPGAVAAARTLLTTTISQLDEKGYMQAWGHRSGQNRGGQTSLRSHCQGADDVDSVRIQRTFLQILEYRKRERAFWGQAGQNLQEARSGPPRHLLLFGFCAGIVGQWSGYTAFHHGQKDLWEEPRAMSLTKVLHRGQRTSWQCHLEGTLCLRLAC